MPDWTAFAGVVGVVLTLLLVLARLSTAHVTGSAASGDATGRVADEDAPGADAGPEATAGATPLDADLSPDEWNWGVDGAGSVDDAADGRDLADAVPPRADVSDLPTSALLGNVALSQGLFGTLLALATWWAEIPLAPLGLAPAFTPELLGLGVALGLTLWVANELAGRAGARFGVDGGEELRALLAPDSPAGWALLLGAVLPLVALFEEFLFRSVLVGAFAAGFALPPWPLVVGSSVAFALGHGAQGRAGMLVTGALGLLLGAAFVVTGSFLVVAVAHYLVNALEFVVHEGFGDGRERRPSPSRVR
ncbi:CPBP family intramembrane glutamic endopeptidase [Halorarum salinum]|uniref:CPBP family intramembrane metalloprotease n=1 Tax=Halorarum salinum TaxID=2743089 RepID=A0A7D5LCB3_9EURY|nr:CPBP family intramembrane glutamic endopeptidase [Halobaculum salinum]QLG63250.1 CPBP family intramembrane metalloprotease [Halobaculum salinum]